MKWVFGLILLTVFALGLGLRVHPENLSAKLHRDNFDNYYQIEFFSGQKMAGQLVSETQETLEITIGAGTAVFKKDEIRSRHLLDAASVKAGKYADLILHSPRQELPLFSVRYEDSIFFIAEKRISLLIAEGAAKFRRQPSDAISPPRNGEPKSEGRFTMPAGLPSAVMPSSAVRGFAADNNQETDYAALVKAGLDQLKSSAK